MEKRALIAIVLSIMVLFAWSYIDQKNRVQRKPTDKLEEVEKVRTPPPVITTAKKPSAAGADIPLSKQTGLTGIPEYMDNEPQNIRDIVVENDLTVAVFTNLGGRLKSYQLKKYNSREGGRFDMLPELDYEDLPLALDFKNKGERLIAADGSELDSSHFTSRVNRAIYEVNTDRLVLNDGSPVGNLVMSYHDRSGIKVIKEFTFRNDRYDFDVNVRVEGLARYAQGVPYRIIWGSAINEDKLRKGRQLDVQVMTFDGNQTRKRKFKKLSQDLEETEPVPWVVLGSKYFAVVMIPGENTVPAVLTRENQGRVGIGLKLRASGRGKANPPFSLYLGPKEVKRLNDLGYSLEKVIDYRWTPFGQTVTHGLAKPLLASLLWFYSFTHNYGVAIILLTIVIKAIFAPLTHKSFKSMQRMQVLQPKIKILRERYKDDKQRLNQEMMQLYRTHKANPMGGCLPMLAQLPIFYALYVVLMYSIELRQAPFIWWIKDLSDYDPYFITPILMGVTMFLQQKMSPTIGDPAQAKLMMMMPVIFTIMFIYFPVGLVIYWMVSNILTIAQQYFIKRKMTPAP